ncbi:MAG TPA: trypsin-like peptidase domain-containing protein [Pyrinomonadaceae bacterium]|nr:trypsin-like peptidase domain-containing protein [Pyrinomonadaceae bacterium]
MKARYIVSIPRIFSVALVGLLVSQFSSAQQLRETFRRVKSAVVIVRSSVADPDPGSSGQVDEEGLGSGVLISTDGKVLTAAHVLEKEGGVSVEFSNGQRMPARVIAFSASADLALLQVDRIPKSAIPAKLGDSDIVETGDDIFIIGAPYGLSSTLTVGRVSRRPDQMRGGILSMGEFLQTDAVINPGNSGGPLFNKEGEVIAIVSNIVSDSGDFRGVGFAATVNAARYLLLEGESARVGIEGVLVTGVVAKALNLPQPAGFLVTAVEKDSLADRLGLVGGQLDAEIDDQRLLIGGDVILAINSREVGADRQAYRAVFSTFGAQKNEAPLRCKILRAGKTLELSLKIPPLPARGKP